MVGKPAEFMLANIADTFKLERHQICMVGDRLDTDILFGQHGGLTTMLVLSGDSLHSESDSSLSLRLEGHSVSMDRLQRLMHSAMIVPLCATV